MSVAKDLLKLGKTNMEWGGVEHSKPIVFHYTPSVTAHLQDICKDKKVFHIEIEDEQLYIDYKSRVAQMVDEDYLALPPVKDGVYVIRLVDRDLVFRFNMVEDCLQVEVFYKPAKTMSVDPTYKYNQLHFIKFGDVKIDYMSGTVDVITLGTYDKCSYEGTTRFIKLNKEAEYVRDFVNNKQVQLMADMKTRILGFIRWFTELNSCLFNCSMVSEEDIKDTSTIKLGAYDILSQFVNQLGSIPRENLEKSNYVTPDLNEVGKEVKPIPHNENDIVDLGICQM